VAEEVVEAMRDERFLIAPHDEALQGARNRAADHERWLRGMRRIWTTAVAA